MKYGSFPKFCLYVCLFLVAFLLVNAVLLAIYDLILIEKVEVFCYHDHNPANVRTLSLAESAKLLALYHLAPFEGEAGREFPCSTYSFMIHYRIGNDVSVGESGNQLIVKGRILDRFLAGELIRSDSLTNYLHELLQCDHSRI